MNSIMASLTRMELDTGHIPTETVTPEDVYATSPMVVVRPTYQQPNEEELHTSFEAAISDRVMALNRKLKRQRIPVTDNLPVTSLIHPLVRGRRLFERVALSIHPTRQTILHITFAFMLVMVGFDFMGLMILLKP